MISHIAQGVVGVLIASWFIYSWIDLYKKHRASGNNFYELLRLLGADR